MGALVGLVMLGPEAGYMPVQAVVFTLVLAAVYMPVQAVVFTLVLAVECMPDRVEVFMRGQGVGCMPGRAVEFMEDRLAMIKVRIKAHGDRVSPARRKTNGFEQIAKIIDKLYKIILMRFMLPRTDCTFDIPDDWWSFAEMQDFLPQTTTYCMPIAAASDFLDIEIVLISEIAPPLARLMTARTLTKARIVPILLALRAGSELPPVQLARIQDTCYKFQLVNGFHRYCASIATGFLAIPGVFHEISWCRPGCDQSGAKLT